MSWDQKRPKDQKEGGWASVKALKQEAALSITGAKRMPGAGKLYKKKKKYPWSKMCLENEAENRPIELKLLSL